MSSRRRTRGDTEEEEAEKERAQTLSPATQLDREKDVDDGNTMDDGQEESVDDSEDGSLMIADMQDAKDTDDTERDSDDEEQPKLIFNGLMTRRQSKQFKDAGDNYAVYSVRAGANKSNKNRTCEYCLVVKATPAALVRHLRKHTGERPFVCPVEQCGKAYKAKRSLHLHQNSYHKGMGKMVAPTPTTLPTKVSVPSPTIAQMSPTPAISEATKSLLRETLESSRKARDGSTGSQTPEALVVTMATGISRLSDRLPTPNLVNLLTSDLTRKVTSDELGHLIKGGNTLSKLHPDVNTNYIVNPVLFKQERDDENSLDRVKEEEEQAEDLSMSTTKRLAKSTPEKRLKCDFCNKSFKHELSRAKHTQTAHGIVINFSGKHQAIPYTVLEPKPSSNVIPPLPHNKQDQTNQKQDVPTDLSFSMLARTVRDNPVSVLSPEHIKMEMPTVGGDGPMLDESNTLPYHVTSRMVQDFNVEDLRLKDTEKSVLAEDGGNRRLRVTVLREAVLATRLDGINNVTGRRATVFKCHLCQRVFSSLLRFNHHLPSHYDTEIQTYDCRYCEASFRSHVQIVKHLQCHREKFTGLNQAGTGLNSSALLLEEFQRKHKEQHSDVALNSSANSTFSPTFHSDESLSGTNLTTEPGERANGGYACVKCRKSFSREYLLQRHMRIHQNQNTYYCPECQSGFSGEQDLLEHRRTSHRANIPEFMQYTNLLKSLNANFDPKLIHEVRQASTSDSNNNTSLGVLPGAHIFPLVEMKAFDLRRGEQVEIRMASDVNDSERGERLRKTMLEGYQTMSPGSVEDSRKTFQLFEQMNSRILQAAMQNNESTALNLGEWQKRTKLDEELKQRELKRLEEEELRLKIEREKRRKLEQEKLKQKLAQEGMGDVTVVLPDAPPPDDTADVSQDVDLTRAADKPTDLSAKPQSVVGFMARKPECSPVLGLTGTQVDPPNTSYSVRSSDAQDIKLLTKSDQSLSSLKRSLQGLVEATTGPPSKNRRKALNPQRIQFDSREPMASDKGDKNPVTKSSSAQIILQCGLNDSAFITTSKLSQPNLPMGLGGSCLSPEQASTNQLPAVALSSTNQLPAVALSSPHPFISKYKTAMEDTDSTSLNNSGAIDLSTDNKSLSTDSKSLSTDSKPQFWSAQSSFQAYTSSKKDSSPTSSSVSPDAGTPQRSDKRISKPVTLVRSVSLDPALDSDNSLSQELTSAADLSKASKQLSLHIQNSSNGSYASLARFSSSLPPSNSVPSPTDPDGLVGCPRVLWKSGQPLPSDVPENFLGVGRGRWNGKGGKSSAPPPPSGSRTSSPSPAPSPTNSDTSSAEGRKVTTTSLSRTHSSARATSLSRTHSRLSVVNEPLDRISLCKPKVLDDGRSVYSCVICHKNFLSLSDINRHMDFHEDIRPYKCKYCDYYARTNSQLKVHKLRHEGVREFCCRVCNYKGVTQSDLNRHMKSQVHLLRSNHVCTQCGEGFVTPKTLRDHLLSCTGSADKSFDAVSNNDEDCNEEDYEDEELMNMEEASQGSNNGVIADVKVAVM
ncbi:unnamed protein product [Lymnaea stagnalis]|uniref:C2H2-type domain-containing protein n=1 Tax=Lymnaea stagnalis TaxID=6523 RepID=A0AAV2I7R8_LYMST